MGDSANAWSPKLALMCGSLFFRCFRLVVVSYSNRSTIVKTVFSPSVVEDLKHRGTEVTEWMVNEISVFAVPLCFDNSLIALE